MSTLNQIIGEFTNTFKGTIQPQINQLTNIELTRHINTGDRIKDNALIIIVNGFISVIISIIFYYLKLLVSLIKGKYFLKKKYIIDYDIAMKDKTIDKVAKYPFSYSTRDTFCLNDISINIILDYITNNNIVSNISLATEEKRTILKQKVCLRILDNNISNEILEKWKDENILETDMGHHVIYFMPIHKYYTDEGEDYIYLVGYYIYSKSFEELNNFIKIILNYANKNNILNGSTKFLNQKKLNIYDTYVDDSKSLFQTRITGELNSNITFNSIYFDDKPELLKWIDKFTEKNIYPKKLSLTNKLGILLYGPPGTGKTGCICALANKLGRNILIINTLSITGKLQHSLIKLIDENKKTSIIVFDEFDYILSDKNVDNNSEYDNICYLELLHSAETPEKKAEIIKLMRENKSGHNSNIVDTRFILSLLDGLGNDEDRIIIATTNNPDKINSVFLRPGRFDVVMKLSFCSFEMFKEIVSTKFEELTDEYFEANRERIQTILKLNITPLILINKLVTISNIELLLSSLTKLPKSTYNLEPQKSVY